eukprot:g37661.t1
MGHGIDSRHRRGAEVSPNCLKEELEAGDLAPLSLLALKLLRRRSCESRSENTRSVRSEQSGEVVPTAVSGWGIGGSRCADWCVSVREACPGDCIKRYTPGGPASLLVQLLLGERVSMGSGSVRGNRVVRLPARSKTRETEGSEAPRPLSGEDPDIREESQEMAFVSRPAGTEVAHVALSNIQMNIHDIFIDIALKIFDS